MHGIPHIKESYLLYDFYEWFQYNPRHPRLFVELNDVLRLPFYRKVLGDKYLFYTKKVRELKVKKNIDPNAVIYLEEKTIKKTVEGEVLDSLGLNKMCCRRHMLSHVDIE